MTSLSDSLHSTLLITATAVVTVATYVSAKSWLWPSRPSVLPNPLKTGLYDKELVYQDDAFPGARDVDTPVSGFDMKIRGMLLMRIILVRYHSSVRVWP